jgi:hypothetical protein
MSSKLEQAEAIAKITLSEIKRDLYDSDDLTYWFTSLFFMATAKYITLITAENNKNSKEVALMVNGKPAITKTVLTNGENMIVEKLLTISRAVEKALCVNDKDAEKQLKTCFRADLVKLRSREENKRIYIIYTLFITLIDMINNGAIGFSEANLIILYLFTQTYHWQWIRSDKVKVN